MRDENVLTTINLIYKDLYEREKKAADYIYANPKNIVNMSVTELAEKSGVSEATIMRLSKKIGCQGFYHFKILLTRNINSEDELTNLSINPEDYRLSIQNIFLSKIEELKTCSNLINSSVVENCLSLIKKCENLFIFGAGNTNTLAVYAAYQFNQYGINTIVNVGPEMQTNAAFSMSEQDLCLLISNSGSSTMIIDIANISKQRKVQSIAITSYQKSTLAQLANYILLSFTNEKYIFEATSSTLMPQMALIDMLILLLSNDQSGDYKQYNSDRELYLSKYKT